jgi:hypothetical protein
MNGINFNICLPTRPPIKGFKSVGTPPSPNHIGLAPGDYVVHPQCSDWGIGQVQSVDNTRVTVNFENAGKQLINAMVVTLVPTTISTNN